MPKTVLIRKKTPIVTMIGMRAENDSTTVGGTPAGILMTQPRRFTHA